MAYEKMRCLYDTERDLVDRLHNTICRYKGKACLVSVMSRVELVLTDPTNGKRIEVIKPSDPDFDISSPEIGYVNYRNSKGENIVYFLERNPNRKYRQGLYAEACTVWSISGQLCQIGGSETVRLFKSQGLVDCIEGKYPTFREALMSIRMGSLDPIAISRDIALDPMRCGVTIIYCHGNDIGYIPLGSTTIEMREDDTAWVMRRMLEKSGVRMRSSNE